jgi:tetratricopeptide (TPR) repeat protein
MELDFVDLLVEVAVNQGVQAAVERYRGLMSEYADYCDFNGDILTSVGDRLLAKGKVQAAIDIIRRGLELYPEWKSIYQRLKLAILEGDEDGFKFAAEGLMSLDRTKKVGLERKLNIMGYRMLEAELTDEALRVFQLNMDLFPESFNVYDSYAEALFLNGDTLSAVSNYEKSLVLNPDNANAVEMIERLRGDLSD